MDLAWLLRDVSPKPNSHVRERDAEEATQGEGQQRCSPSQVEARWAGPLHQSPGRWDDPVAQARGQAICAEIWRDAQQGDLDLSLNRYRPLLQGLSLTLQHLGWRRTVSGVYRFRCPYCQHDSHATGYVHKGYLHSEKGSPG